MTTAAGPEALDAWALVYGTRSVTDAQVSPDGTRLVYTLAEADETKPAEKAKTQLRTCALDGTGAASLTEAGSRDHHPRWSPDGRSIAFIREREEGSELAVVPASGGVPTTLVCHPLEISWVAWAPGGDRLVYTALVDPEDPTAGPDPLVRVTRRLDYQEDGRGYLGDRRFQVFVIAAAGGSPQRLTREPLDHRFPIWSPDGRKIAFQVSQNAGQHSWLRVQPVDGPDHVEVRFGERGTVDVASWSPAGDRLLVAADPDGSSQPDLFLVDAVQGNALRLTDDLRILPVGPGEATPHWLDDRTVLLSAARHGATDLYRFDVETREVTALTDGKSAPTGLSVDRAAAHVVQVHASPSSLGEISVWDRERRQSTVVTRFNDELFRGRPTASWERIELQRGGLTIEGWLFFPPDFDPAVPHPMVLDVHGGPHGHHGYGFQPVIELLATHGFLVLACNPRGSGGYGRAFATAVARDWGGEDHLDLEAAVDLVAARPYVDERRLGVYGYSYGGFMVSWIIGHTDRYRAAVCGAPCFDLVSDYGSSDISPFTDPVEFGARPWEDPGWYREHSPATEAHRATTPTLILHGEADVRCPIGQGEQLFATLVQAGCDTEFVRYPGASHLFFRSGPAGQRADYLNRVLEWFQRHLQAPSGGAGDAV